VQTALLCGVQVQDQLLGEVEESLTNLIVFKIISYKERKASVKSSLSRCKKKRDKFLTLLSHIAFHELMHPVLTPPLLYANITM